MKTLKQFSKAAIMAVILITMLTSSALANSFTGSTVSPGPSGGNYPCACTGTYNTLWDFTNGGLKCQPAAGTTGCIVKVYAGGTLMNTADYVVRWKVSALDVGCCAISGGAYVHNSTPTKKYTYMVYFRNTPPAGTTIVIEVSYQ